MLTIARSLFAVNHEQQRALKAFLAFNSTINRDVAEANQELDEFFGISNSSCSSSSRPSTPFSPDGPSRHRDGKSFTLFSGASPAMSGGFSGVGRATSPWVRDSADSSLGLAAAQDIICEMAPEQGPQQQELAHLQQHPELHPQHPHHEQCQQQHQRPQHQHQRPHLQLQERKLTHIDASGSASMVDVSQKAVTAREAQASCVVALGEAFAAVAANSLAKGDVLKVAQLAGISGAKATASLIPLCHNIPISKVDVQLHLDEPSRSVVVRALARTDGKTGVEMEALTAASVAALTVYDMCKAAAKDLVVGQLQLDYKSGGRSGTYLRAGLQRGDLLPSARPPL